MIRKATITNFGHDDFFRLSSLTLTSIDIVVDGRSEIYIPKPYSQNYSESKVFLPNEERDDTFLELVTPLTTSPNTIVGTSGDDRISSGNADDLVSGGEGNDTIFGALGADTLNGNNGEDILRGGSGNVSAPSAPKIVSLPSPPETKSSAFPLEMRSSPEVPTIVFG
ncbi:MAG: hypothetical protein AAFQ04_07640, partial [Pseudomonadota bacterium]